MRNARATVSRGPVVGEEGFREDPFITLHAAIHVMQVRRIASFLRIHGKPLAHAEEDNGYSKACRENNVRVPEYGLQARQKSIELPWFI